MNDKYTRQSQIDEMRAELDKEIAAPKKPNFSKIFGTIAFYLLLAFFGYVFIDVTVDKKAGRVPDLFGLSFYEIESSSMEPTLQVGSILVSKAFDQNTKVSVGDVVTFKMLDGRIVTHRVVEIVNAGTAEESYRTKGDNPINGVDGEILTRDRILALFLFKLPLT